MPRLRLLPLLLLAGAAHAQAPAAPDPEVQGTDAVTPCYSTATGLVGDCHTAQAPVATETPLTLTVDEAVTLALARNYAVQLAELDVANANAQIREQWGQLFPQASLTSSYTRNVVTANPFAGSDAGGLFGSLGALDWLAFNERARTDDDPTTEPISLDEFLRRQAEGQQAAGIESASGDNPFAVPNQFFNGVSVTQTLYSGAAFAAVRGAESLREINQAALAQRRDETIHQTRQLYYGALLAARQADVVEASVERTVETVAETDLLVAQGVVPKLNRLQAEVQLANLQTELIQARTAAAAAKDQLLLTLGLPVDQPLALRGELAPPDALYRTAGLVDALGTALGERPDLAQARLAVRLQEVQRNIERAAYFPSVSAFADLGITGNVPDNRQIVTQTGPFQFEADDRGFFDGDYWQPTVSVGVRLNWTIFDGFQRGYRMQQRRIAVEQAELQMAQAEEAAKLEVAQALRAVESARQRLAAQTQTVETAETAYGFAFQRLTEGVGTQLDVRQASDNLDQSRLLYLQAIYDLLVARSNLERALGTIAPVGTPTPPPATTTSASR
ncbi:MAG: TolC family protein [Rubricoccaceae bacterium]|nr:TolC family protein [Rubricoccaceae bacterium]